MGCTCCFLSRLSSWTADMIRPRYIQWGMTHLQLYIEPQPLDGHSHWSGSAGISAAAASHQCEKEMMPRSCPHKDSSLQLLKEKTCLMTEAASGVRKLTWVCPAKMQLLAWVGDSAPAFTLSSNLLYQCQMWWLQTQHAGQRRRAEADKQVKRKLVLGRTVSLLSCFYMFQEQQEF